MNFEENVGIVDRTIRVLLGFGMIGLLVYLEGPLRWVGLLGVVLLATAVFSVCPLYTLLGFRTSATKPDRG